MLKDILSAIRFATIFPAGKDAFTPRRIAAGLPAAGLLAGLLLAIFDQVASDLWSPAAVAALDVVFLAVISGALHLDGLADTADGLYAGHSKARALEIMKDSRTGAMGVVAIACCLLVKWAGLADLGASRFWLILLVPAYARAGVLFGFRFFDYGRKGEGTALAFFEEPLSAADFRWLVVLAGFSMLTGWQTLTLNLGFVCITAGILWFYKWRLGCITGDMLGAMIEVTEALLFLIVAIG